MRDRKDGRIVRGLQRGTTSFTHSTTLSFLDVTNKLLTVIKVGLGASGHTILTTLPSLQQSWPLM